MSNCCKKVNCLKPKCCGDSIDIHGNTNLVETVWTSVTKYRSRWQYTYGGVLKGNGISIVDGSSPSIYSFLEYNYEHPKMLNFSGTLKSFSLKKGSYRLLFSYNTEDFGLLGIIMTLEITDDKENYLAIPNFLFPVFPKSKIDFFVENQNGEPVLFDSYQLVVNAVEIPVKIDEDYVATKPLFLS